MSPKNDFSDIFDDDFEVTYEEDPEINFHTSEDTEQINRPDSNTETLLRQETFRWRSKTCRTDQKRRKGIIKAHKHIASAAFYCVNSGHNSICTLQLLPCKHTVRRYPGGNPDTEDFPDSGRLLMCSCPLPVLRIHLPSLVNDTRPRT